MGCSMRACKSKRNDEKANEQRDKEANQALTKMKYLNLLSIHFLISFSEILRTFPRIFQKLFLQLPQMQWL